MCATTKGSESRTAPAEVPDVTATTKASESRTAAVEAPDMRASIDAGESRTAAAEVPATAGARESRKTFARVHHAQQTTEANDLSSAATEAHGSPTDSETRGSEDASAETSRPMLSGSRAERYQVVLYVDPDTLRSSVESGRSELADGTRLSPETARRLSCDAGLVRVTRGRDGAILDVGWVPVPSTLMSNV